MKNTSILRIILFILFANFSTSATSLVAADSAKTSSQVERDVDALIAKSGSGSATQSTAVKDIQKIGKAAVPRLIFHATQEFVTQKEGVTFGSPKDSFARDAKIPNPKRYTALYLLKFVWSDDAIPPLVNILKNDSNQDARLLAFDALDKNAWDSLKPVIPSLVSDKNPEIAGIVFGKLETQSPDLERMISAVARPEMWKSLELYLPRYYSSKLTPKTLALLKNSKTTDEKAMAIVSLISQNANSDEDRKYIAGFMKSYDPAIREIAAEYLSWHGTETELPYLDDSLKTEQDIYALASMKAASASIKRRSAVKPAPGVGDAISAPTSFKDALQLLQAAENRTSVVKSFEFLKKSEAFEPLFVKGKKENEPFIEQRSDRMNLTGLIFCIPALCGDCESTEKKMDTADTVVPPIRSYLDQTRKYFGGKIGRMAADGGEVVRVCDNAGLRKTYLTVVAIGNGTVKSAEYTQGWGYAVIIEHAGSDGGKFCSVYAHLSPFIHVRKNDIVSTGEKIGSIGRHFTWENGGFGACLQFAIYNGAFDSPQSLLVSHIQADEFTKNLHKWVNPQSFIQEKMKGR